MCLAVPAELLEIIDETDFPLMGKVSFGGIIKEICLVYVPQVKRGDFVLVHVGFAIRILDLVEVEKVFATLNELN